MRTLSKIEQQLIDLIADNTKSKTVPVPMGVLLDTVRYLDVLNDVLIENMIFSMKDGTDFSSKANKAMLKNVGISETDLYLMAQHVVYSLYDGKFPEV